MTAVETAPYAAMSDEELEAERSRMLDRYIDRLMYFDALPGWQCAANVMPIGSDPAAWGLTCREFRDWCEAISEHWREGRELGQVRTERSRRLREAARRRVSRCDATESAEAACAALTSPDDLRRAFIGDVDDVRSHVIAWEEMMDGFALRQGARMGYIDAKEADMGRVWK